MLRSGICSISFRKLPIREIVNLGVRAGLEGIEWGGDVHVPHGDLKTAAVARKLCRDAGLACPSYGSYYRVGTSETQGLNFADVLATAAELGAVTIRVWAGTTDIEKAAPEDVARVVDDTFRIARLAEKEGRTISFEYHGGTYTNTPANALAFAARVPDPAVRFYWQPPHGFNAAECVGSMLGLLDRVTNLHVFTWRCTSRADGSRVIERLLLEEGADPWRKILALVASSAGEHWAHLEFALNDDPENTLRDAVTLKRLVAEAQNGE
jgi:3-dehydroshikimate dehydratase